MAARIGLTLTTLLDTTVVIDLLRGSPAIRARLETVADRFLISAITVDEVLAGMRSHEEAATSKLLDALPVASVARAEATVSGDWRRQYRARGVTIKRGDALIAACALLRGATLATANVRDFPMAELRVEHWPSGAG